MSEGLSLRLRDILADALLVESQFAAQAGALTRKGAEYEVDVLLSLLLKELKEGLLR